MAAAGCGLKDYDPSNPQAFYLGERQAELETLADATLIVEGTRLPVHTGVLAAASPVLSGAFSGAGGSAEQACPSCGLKRKREEGDELVLEAPFRGFALFDVALFLKLLYSPAWLADAPATLGGLHDSLPALLRLAHQLNTPSLLAALCAYMPGASCAAISPLIAWIEAAAECQLDDLQLRLTRQLAHRVAALHDTNLADTLAGTRVLEQCDPRTLVQIIAMLVDAGISASPNYVSDGARLAHCIPSRSSLVEAVATAACSACFDWTLAQFSKQVGEPGQSVTSPWFTAAGFDWRFVVCQGGADEDNAGFLAVMLECSTSGVHARFKVAVLNSARAASRKEEGNEVFQATVPAGFPRFILWRSASELLNRDCLYLRATVTVLPS